MNRTTVASIFANSESLGGTTLTVAGWARSIRDSKAVGFVALNDGSCFNNLQVVLSRDVLRACADARRPAAFRAQGAYHRGRGSLGSRLPAAEEAPHRRVPAHHPAPAPPHQPVQRRVPRALCGRLRHPLLLPGAWLRLCEHAHHHRKRLRGRRRDVPRDHDRPGQPTARRPRQRRLQPGLLRQGCQPHGFGPAPGRELRHGVRRRLHLRPDVPRSAMPPSSGWWSPRSPSPTSRTT